ncbi:MAG: hypothetical protein A2Z72_01975 [Omnitrophica bacterium RBG_13_46_9]|nr:MAG: hypothetical protein A2Z72_01975 [Omnitrophica bacterium RBG_13_46_9]
MFHFNIYAIPHLLASLLLFSLAIFVFVNNKTSPINKTFALLNICTVIWLFGYFVMFSATNSSVAKVCSKIIYVGVLFIPIVFYHFVISFLEIKNNGFLIRLNYVIGAIFTILLFTTNLITSGLYKYFWGFQTKVGSLHNIYLIFFFILFIRCFILLKKEEKKATSAQMFSKALRIKYIFWPFLISIIASTDFLSKYGIESYPIGFLFMSTFVSITTYAIVKHQLLEIEVIVKKTLVFAGLLASVFAMLVLPTLVIQEYIFGGTGTAGRLWGLAISGTIIILTVRRIENFLIDITDKFLFQKKYDYKELLKTFTDEVLTVLNIDILVNTTVDKLSKIMKIQSCGLLLLNKTKNSYELVASMGLDKEGRDISLGSDNTLASFLRKTKSYLSTKHQGKDSPLPKRIIEDMNKLKLALAIPLIIYDDMIGILTLGNKKSDEDYTQDDMDILLPLARTLSIAISNAIALDELSKTQAEAAQREKMAVIGTLSAGINHEICNPLGIARGQCEAFLLNIKDGLYKDKSMEELFDKAQKIMEKVIHETDRATAITKRLSSFAKPAKGVISDDVNIKDEVDEVLALVGYELKLDKIDIIKDIQEGLPFISGDKKQLQEVFFNLIRNAAQAIKEKGKIIIRAREDGGNVIIDIEDTGHGIPEDKLDQIFNPFYTTKDPGKGTGLGLFIVRQVVEKNLGRIFVKSKVNEGTTFTLEFPVAVRAKA